MEREISLPKEEEMEVKMSILTQYICIYLENIKDSKGVTNSMRCRDVREFKQRYENMSRENMRKEKQLRDLQSRLESGEGCK